MAEYTVQDYIDMIILYDVAGENARTAARLYALSRTRTTSRL